MDPIDRIECVHDGDPAEFMVCSDGGAIHVGADGIVVFSYDSKVAAGQHVSSFAGSNVVIEEVLGSCPTCEDEASIRIHFKDGTVTEDEDAAFFKAFGIKSTALSTFTPAQRGGPIPPGLAQTLAKAMGQGTKVIGVGSGGMTQLSPQDLTGDDEDAPREAQPIDKAVEALNALAAIDSSAVKVLVDSHQVPCAAEVEDQEGVTVKAKGIGHNRQTYITPLSLVNAAVYALTGKKVAMEIDDNNDVKFVVD